MSRDSYNPFKMIGTYAGIALAMILLLWIPFNMAIVFAPLFVFIGYIPVCFKFLAIFNIIAIVFIFALIGYFAHAMIRRFL